MSSHEQSGDEEPTQRVGISAGADAGAEIVVDEEDEEEKDTLLAPEGEEAGGLAGA